MHLRRLWYNASCVLILAALATAFVPGIASACTTVHMTSNGSAMGKSYDWDIGYGLVVINKRGVSKVAMPTTPGDTAVTWTSQYGSVTFNQYGVEMPHGGINEAGLMVELMWLDGTQYPAADERSALNELQWLQWALDNHGTVDELAAAADSIRVSRTFATLHYLACDASDECASFEYLGGELVVHAGADMVVDTLTNDTYATSVEYLELFVGFGGDQPIPTSASSLDRFVRASSLALADQTEDLPDAAFSILDSVSQGPASVWNIVYMPDESSVHFRTYTESDIRSVDLTTFDLDCTAPTMILDIDPGQSGDVSGSFEPYSEEANRALIEQSFADIIDYLPEGIIDSLVTYPGEQECTLTAGDDDDDDDDDDSAADDDSNTDGCSCTTSPSRFSALPCALPVALLSTLIACRWLFRCRRWPAP